MAILVLKHLISFNFGWEKTDVLTLVCRHYESATCNLKHLVDHYCCSSSLIPTKLISLFKSLAAITYFTIKL